MAWHSRIWEVDLRHEHGELPMTVTNTSLRAHAFLRSVAMRLLLPAGCVYSVGVLLACSTPGPQANAVEFDPPLKYRQATKLALAENPVTASS